MKKAKYYIYRNLHQKSFSVSYRGKVIAHPKSFVAVGCEFRVSENGRQRVLAEKQKNVHAKIACDSWSETVEGYDLDCLDQLYYNPYKVSQFQCKGQDILSTDTVVGVDGEHIYKK